jgi:hypothetical protein
MIQRVGLCAEKSNFMSYLKHWLTTGTSEKTNVFHAPKITLKYHCFFIPCIRLIYSLLMAVMVGFINECSLAYYYAENSIS